MVKNNFLTVFILILFLLPGIWSLFHPGFPLSDDGEWMIIRFSAFYENLVNGQFPIRFLSRLNGGFGYPVANFLYPLFMYIGAPIHLAGFSFIDTIKIILGGSLLLGGVFSFLWLRKLFNNTASFIGALVYSLFPYHLWDIYKRGSVGEVLALAVVPFIFWQIERKNLTLVSLSIGALIASHNTLALLFLPVVVIYMILTANLKFALLTLFLGFGISAFFWLPAIYDLQFTVFSQTSVSNFSEYFVNRLELGLLGLITLFLLSLSVLAFRKDKKFLYFLFITLTSILFSLELSSVLWPYFSPFVQFPFRFLSVTMLGISYLAAFIISTVEKKFRKAIFVAILVLVFLSAKDFLTLSKFQDFPDSYYSTNQATTTVKNEYMPKWVKDLSPDHLPKIEVVEGDVETSNVEVSANKITFQTSGVGKVQINTVYFPGWKVYVDSQEVKINYEENGLMRFSVENDANNVEVRFGETNVRLISDLISILSLGLIIGWLRFK